MDALAGPFLGAAALLVVAGGPKIVDPAPLVRALRGLGLRLPTGVVRAVAFTEVVVGAAAIGTGGRVAAAAVAAAYAVFTVVVVLARRRDAPLMSCGCFGRRDVPPTRLHAVVTAAAVGVATAVALRPVGALPDLLHRSPAYGVPLVVVTTAIAAAAYLVLAVLPLLGRDAIRVAR